MTSKRLVDLANRADGAEHPTNVTVVIVGAVAELADEMGRSYLAEGIWEIAEDLLAGRADRRSIPFRIENVRIE